MLSLTNEQIDEIIYQIPLKKGIPQRVVLLYKFDIVSL